MILALDIGNTFIKTGIFDNGKIIFSEKIKAELFPSAALHNYPIEECAVSSVVPSVSENVKALLLDQFNIDPYIIKSNSAFTIKIDYATPSTLGTDRVCGAEGAYKLFLGNNKELQPDDAIISIDFGTATTINLIRHPNLFTGGIIAPGIRMMFEALNKNTSQLPNVNFDEYKNVIGNSTNSAIASGVLNSAAGLIKIVRSFLTDKLNTKNIFTYITGGNAESIIPSLDFNFEYEPDLVLYGIHSVLLRNKKV